MKSRAKYVFKRRIVFRGTKVEQGMGYQRAPSEHCELGIISGLHVGSTVWIEGHPCVKLQVGIIEVRYALRRESALALYGDRSGQPSNECPVLLKQSQPYHDILIHSPETIIGPQKQSLPVSAASAWPTLCSEPSQV